MEKLTPEARFWAKVYRSDTPDGCWTWQGYLDKKGYGHLRIHKDLVQSAHRFAYELLVGLIPEGLMLDHVCHTQDSSCLGGIGCKHRSCVNPAHLRPTTALGNAKPRTQSPGDPRGNRTACRKGHPYNAENSRINKRGHHECRVCARLQRQRDAALGKFRVPSKPALPRPTCSVVERGVPCQRPVEGIKHGMCLNHYRRWKRYGDPLGGWQRLSGTPIERFVAKVETDPVTGCHIWTASKDADGYGMFRGATTTHKAHTWLWREIRGPIDPGLELHHLCNNASCVNLDHMKPVPHVVNLAEQWRRRNGLAS